MIQAFSLPDDLVSAVKQLVSSGEYDGNLSEFARRAFKNELQKHAKPEPVGQFIDKSKISIDGKIYNVRPIGGEQHGAKCNN